MKFSTGLKKRSRLQGHRKRRRTFEVIIHPISEAKLSWVEYKTVRQYQAMGDMLDDFKVYGFRGGVENILNKNMEFALENGSNWLTEDESF